MSALISRNWMNRSVRSAAIAIIAALPMTVFVSVATAQEPAATEAPATLTQRSERAYQAGNFPESIKLADQAIEQNANDHAAYYLRASAKIELGIGYQESKWIVEGISDVREAIRIEGTGKPEYYLPYIYGMAHLSTIENKPAHAETAISVADQNLKREDLTKQQKANLLYQRALANVQLGKMSDAENDLSSAIAAVPKHMAAHLALVDVYDQQGDLARAEQQFNKIVAAFPEDPLAVNNRGMFLVAQGKTEQAIADFNQALKVDSQFFQAYTNRGFAMLEAGRPKEAIAEFGRSLQLQPQQPGTYSLRASAKLVTGDAAGAIADYQQSIKLDPNNPVAKGDLGFAYFFAGKYSEAAETFRQASEAGGQLRFLNPWRYAALVYSGKAAEAKTIFGDIAQKPADQRDWFDMLTLLLMGEVTSEQVAELTKEADPKVQQAQLCEVNYFTGLRKSIERDQPAATAAFRKAFETDATQLSAHRGSRFALREFVTR